MDLGRPFLAVTPTVDGDVLAVLAQHDATFTSGQLHRTVGRHSEEGIRKVLRRLTEQGVVLAERVGHAFAYRLNRDHLAAQHIIGLASIRTTFVEAVREEIEKWSAPPVWAVIFGSAARGTMTAHSDIDLMLIRPSGVADDVWGAQVNRLVLAMTRWTGNDTRPVEFTVEEIVANGHREPVLRDALRDGLTVAGHRSWLARQLGKGDAAGAHEAV